MLGMGPFPTENEVDPDLINAGKQTITELDRTSYFSSAESFAMIRGGHIDLSHPGRDGGVGDRRSRQLDGAGQAGEGQWAARWISSPASSAASVTMDHTDKAGHSKLLKTCTLPLTGKACGPSHHHRPRACSTSCPAASS